jgi:parallel beta-helix repeat protein
VREREVDFGFDAEPVITTTTTSISATTTSAATTTTVAPTTTTTILQAPGSLQAHAVGANVIMLTWTDNSSAEQGFRIQRDAGSGFADLATVGARSTSYSSTGLAPSTPYTYRICVYNSEGSSAYSNEASATTQHAGYVHCSALPVPNAYYVDADGLCGACDDGRTKQQNSITTPWCTIQHGMDAAAPGDSIYARGGTYREEVTLHVSGTQPSPITLSAFPGESAVLEGADALTGFSACPSAEVCLNAENWEHLSAVTIPAGIAAVVTPLTANLHEGSDMLWVSQEPDQPDPFFMDVIDNFYSIAHENVTRSSITDPARLNQPDEHYWDSAYALVWVTSNRVNFRPINSYIPASNMITFDNTTTPPYTDRDELYSLYNSIHLIDQPGEYCIKENPDNITLYVWPRQAADNMSISVRTFGIDINNRSHITIDGMTVQRYSGDLLTNGVGIGTVHRSADIAGITIKNCTVRHNRKDADGYGGIFLDRCADCLVEGNLLEENVKHYGVFVMNALRMTVRNNTIIRSGRTALTYYGSDNSSFTGNTISGCKGSHTNTITVYLYSNNILVAGNMITDSYGGMSLQNSSNVTYYNNVVDAENEEQTFNEWPGASGGTIAVLNNIFVNNSRHVSLNLGGRGAQYIVKNNILDGYCADAASTVWTHNLYTGLEWCQDPDELQEGELIETDLTKIFTDPAHAVYLLTGGSPAIDAGTDISSYLPTAIFPDYDFTKDRDGNQRMQGSATDMGAYEAAP